MFNNSNDNTIKRFLNAHKGEYKGAYKEIQTGKKTSHWIWYIFPQLKTLGYSDTAKYYGICDFNEACNYLKDPLLFKHYNEMVELVELQLQKGIVIEELMNGNVDAKKLTSSLTLFCATARHLAAIDPESFTQFTNLANCCDGIFKIIARQGYYRCAETQKIIKKQIKSDTTLIDRKIDSKKSPVDISDNQPIIPKENKTNTSQDPEPIKTKLQTNQSQQKEPSNNKTENSNFVKSPPIDLKLLNKKVTTHTPTTSRGLSAGSSNLSTSMDPADKPRDVGVRGVSEQLHKKLDNYLVQRTNEWNFHSNFLGIVAVIYYLQDAITGTDHFNSKSRSTKINAATKLKNMIESTSDSTVRFTSAETKALKEGRLGDIVTSQGGLDKIITQAPKQSNLSNPSL